MIKLPFCENDRRQGEILQMFGILVEPGHSAQEDVVVLIQIAELEVETRDPSGEALAVDFQNRLALLPVYRHVVPLIVV